MDRSGEPGGRAFAWTVWLAMTAATLAFVLRYGPTVPLGDDYAIVPALAGVRPVTPAWLWSLHNEHRLPLPRLVLLAVDRLSGGDFRAGMVATWTCLAAASAALMIAASRGRGYPSATDALFPLFLLHWGHANNLLWNWQVAFGLSTLLASLLAAVVAWRGGPLGLGRLLLIGMILAALPLCSASGLSMVPAAVAWLAGLGIVRSRSGDRSGAVACWAAALPAALLVAFYFVDYERPKQIEAASGIAPVVRTAFQVLAIGLGPPAGDAWRVAGGAVLAVAVAAGLTLARLAVGTPEERTRATGLLAVGAGFGLLTLGLAWGRAGGNERSGLELRYVTLTAPLSCLAALAWARAGSPAVRRFASVSLFAGACVLLWPNLEAGLEHGRDRHSRSVAAVADVRDGLPPYRVIRRNSPFLHTSHDVLTRMLPILRDAGLSPFRDLAEDPSFRVVDVPPRPSSLRLAEWDPATRTIRAVGVDPWVTFPLPGPFRVAGVRLRYDHRNDDGTTGRFKIRWRFEGQVGFPDGQEAMLWTLPTGADQELTWWIDGPVVALQIQPDNRPCTFRVRGIELLVPGPPAG